MEKIIEKPLSPEKLLQLGTGFWASKVFLCGIKMNLFTVLSQGPLSLPDIQKQLHLHDRAVSDFLDSLVALGVLVRENGTYANTPETQVFFNRNSPAYLGGMMEMANDRLYEFWGRLETALQSGKPQSEIRTGGDYFGTLYANPEKVRIFQEAMIGLSLGSSAVLAEAVDFSQAKVYCDIGGGPGTLCFTLARRYPSLRLINFDFPQTKAIFDAHAKQQGLESRVEFCGGNCLKDPLPAADVYSLGHVLHGWGGGEESHFLLKKIFEALPKQGRLLVVEAMIDNERRSNVFGLLMSLDMLIETDHGRNFTSSELESWVKKAGFKSVLTRPLVGPYSVTIAEKG